MLPACLRLSSREVRTARTSPPFIAHLAIASSSSTLAIYGWPWLLTSTFCPAPWSFDSAPRPEFSAHVAGSDPWLLMHALNSEHLTVALPPGAALDPPTDPVLPTRPEGAASWANVPIPITRMRAGELRLSERLLLHVSGPLSRWPFPGRETSRGEPAQPQLRWALPGWNLRLAEVGGPEAVEDFSFVVEAVPHDRPLGLDATERLCDQVFLLLSLIAGQEIGVGPVAGADAAGRIVWADWYAPRFRPEHSAWRWCPRHLVNQALPALATGLSSLADDPALQQVVDRAGRHLLAANGPDVLDVRIPVACSGLELLGWAVLQRHQWLTRDGLRVIA
jgi:hypothetical protein